MNNDDILVKMHSLHLVLAEELKRICEKHHIRYFMIAGTLLGAVRHKGFIPWDDDMDFGMLREDYDRFVKICGEELDKEVFYLQTSDTDRYYTFNFVKLRLKGTRVLEEFSSKTNTDQGIYIDIFPIDHVSDNPLMAAVQYKSFWFFRNLLWVKCGYGEEERKKQLSYKVARFLSGFFTISFLKKMKYRTITCCMGRRTKKVVTSDGTYGLKKETLSAEWVENLATYEFEHCQYPGIADYDAYLSYFYGDYMKLPPESKRDHHKRLMVDFGDYESGNKNIKKQIEDK
ncbi:MAG: phosphorylcholine transferase LicD [Lachnospiraceae bacterium]